MNGARGQPEWGIGNDIISTGPDKVMFWARLPFILLATLLGLVIYVWGRTIVGDTAALSALFLYALDPTVIAHSYLVTTDSGMAAFTVIFLFAIWKYVQYPSLKRLLMCGVTLGAALCTKFAAVALAPIAAVLLFAAVRWPALPGANRPRTFLDPYLPPKSDLRTKSDAKMSKAGPNELCPCGSGKKYKKCHGAARANKRIPLMRSGTRWRIAFCGVAFLAICVVAFVVVEALYFFPSDPFLYITGFHRVNADHTPDYQVYMAGQFKRHFWSYFAVAYLVKEPIADIILVVLGLITLLRTKDIRPLGRLFLLLPPAVLFAGYTYSADNLGIRYIIPVLPFLCLVGGLGLSRLVRGPNTWGRGAAAALCTWLIVAAAGIYPDHLSYFNEAACLSRDPSRIGLDGGSKCGPLWLDDSNVDWGGGVKQLMTWLERNAKARNIRMFYFGSFPPERYGLRYEKMEPQELGEEPRPGLNVVSAHAVARVPSVEGANQWLRNIRPTAIVGHAYYVYDVPAKSAEHGSAR